MKRLTVERVQNPVYRHPGIKKMFRMKLNRASEFNRGQPGKARKESHRKNTPRRMLKNKRKRRLRCDCGKTAVAVVAVWVGTDPQYLIKLPLCSECLALENSLKSDA
jgi:hypothetical protein